MTCFALFLAFACLSLVDAVEIRQALRYADISLKSAALWMGMDARHLDRQLNGEGHLKHDALLKLPLGFWQWYVVLMIEKYGLPKEVRRALIVDMAMRSRRRQARIGHSEERKALA